MFTMDKDMKSLMQAIKKVVASDHRIRDKLSSPKETCDSAGQAVSGALANEVPKQTGQFE
jgi:hypothetical protein